VRRGVRAVLEGQPGWEVCGEASTGLQAVDLAVGLQPDIVVLDISMPELNGLEATRQIRRRAPQLPVLILTVHECDEVIREVLDAGANAYILKSEAGRTLVEAIRGVLARGRFLTPRVQVAATRAAGTRQGATKARGAMAPLTARERQVLQLLTEGKANKEVAALLGMSTKTAETHRAHIFAKLDVHSMSELVRYAIRNRIIEP
jgi:DNA-binding NarL/FixJ family response regulator